MYEAILAISIFVFICIIVYIHITHERREMKRMTKPIDEETQRQLYWKNYYEVLVKKGETDILHTRERKYFYMLDMWHKMWRVHRYIVVFYVVRNLYYDHPSLILNFPVIKKFCYEYANKDEFIPKLLDAETDEDELEIDRVEALHLYRHISANINDFVF